MNDNACLVEKHFTINQNLNWINYDYVVINEFFRKKLLSLEIFTVLNIKKTINIQKIRKGCI